MHVGESFQVLGPSGVTPSTPPQTGSASVESDEYAQAVSAYIKEVVDRAVKAEGERIALLLSEMDLGVEKQIAAKLIQLLRNGD